jgi:nucleoside-diphosphate-sugar epimerase
MTQLSSTVLILGANGRFGHHTALAFARAGWRVIAQVRSDKQLNDAIADHSNIETLAVDLKDTRNLSQAARKFAVIVNGLNPPYRLWHKTVATITNSVLQLARESGATVILPGNVYVYGNQMPEQLTAHSPHQPTNQLGQIRSAMEQQYQQASNEGIQTIVLRIGDFLQRDSTGNWFDTHMTGGLCKGRFAYPGRRDVAHAFGYLPDTARACVALAEIRNDLPAYADIPFAGTTVTGDQLHQLVEQAMGTQLKEAGIPWPIIRLLALFNGDMRGVVAMRYLWNTPHRLDGEELQKYLPDFRPTPDAEIIADCVSRFAPERKETGGLHQPLAIRH